MTHRVFFDFEDEGTCDAFMDAVMEWLTEPVQMPPDLEDKALEEFGGTLAPRHWLYEDASPSSVLISDTGNAT